LKTRATPGGRTDCVLGKPTPRTNTDLEILRAVAIAFTLLCHMGWDILPKLGPAADAIHSRFKFWTGVDLFFAISGFIITASLCRAGVTQESFLRFAVPFWIRRIFRLLPSAWLWIGLTLLLTAGFNSNLSFGLMRYNLHEAAAAVANVANFYYYRWFSAGHSDYGSFGVFWSLSLEEQFYLIFPFLLYFASRRVLVGALACAFLGQVFAFRPAGFVPHQSSLLWFVRTDALILGVLIALWQDSPSYERMRPRFLQNAFLSLPILLLGVLLLAGVAASVALARWTTGLAALISGSLVLIASYDANYLLKPSRPKSALMWLGSRSYSIYLIHVTVRALVLEYKKSWGIPEGSAAAGLWTLASLVLILAVSELNYRLVETPFRSLGRQIAGRLQPKAGLRSSIPAPVAAAVTD